MRAVLRAGCFVCAVAVASGPSVVAADSLRQSTTSSAPATLLKPQARPKPNPYGRLFLLPGQDTATSAPRIVITPRAAAVSQPRPTVVCGTRLLPIDPGVDPGIYAAVPGDDTRHAMRAVEPPICSSR